MFADLGEACCCLLSSSFVLKTKIAGFKKSNQILITFWDFLTKIGPKHRVGILSIETRPLAYFFFLVIAHRLVLKFFFLVRNAFEWFERSPFLKKFVDVKSLI
jgi:hypothetical protein